MIGISFFYIALITTVVWIIYRIVSWRSKTSKSNKYREIFVNLFFIYFLSIIYFTIFKDGLLWISFNKSFDYNYNLTPLRETVRLFTNDYSDIKFALFNVFGNVLLFVPLGFFIPLLSKKCNRIIKVIVFAFYSSCLIEVLQYFTQRNITDIDDVIFNTIGAFIGIILYRVFLIIFRNLHFDKFFDNISNSSQKSLIRMAMVPILILLLCCSVVIFIMFYRSTYSASLSDIELYKSAFEHNGDGQMVAVKDYDKYKLFLVDYGDYLELRRLEKVAFNRYINGVIEQLNWDQNNFGYKVTFLNDYDDNEDLVAVVFGKNDSAQSITASLFDEKFSDNLKPNEFFIKVLPSKHKHKNDEETDIYKFNSGESCEDLKISFLEANGQKNLNMELMK